MELHYIVREPEVLKKRTEILFLIHGYGSNENDLFSFTPDLPEDMIVVSFRAPIELSYGSYAWYELNFTVAEKFINIPQATESLNKILKSVKKITDHYNLNTHKVHLCGFSQGGILSYALSLGYPQFFSKVACLSAYPEKGILNHIEKDRKKLAPLRFFISHGTEDAVIPIEWGRKAVDLLYDLGCFFSFKEYVSGHGINPKNYRDLMDFFLQT
ncbi:MAG: phospholipase [Bergeyella sp.]|nr:phospholipase [Bergeyella sp.]